jgi:hypothetical protein
MITTGYVVEEVLRDLPDFPPLVSGEWVRLRSELLLMEDVITLDRPAVPVRVRKVGKGLDAEAALERFVDWGRTLSAISELSNGRTWPRTISGAGDWWVTSEAVIYSRSGSYRNAIESRFQELMLMTARFRSTSSCSEKTRAASA